jgi:hypothetical protein
VNIRFFFSVEDIAPVSERSEQSCEDKKYRHYYWKHIHKLIECPVPRCKIYKWSNLPEMIEYDQESYDPS